MQWKIYLIMFLDLLHFFKIHLQTLIAAEVELEIFFLNLKLCMTNGTQEWENWLTAVYDLSRRKALSPVSISSIALNSPWRSFKPESWWIYTLI